MCGREVTSCTGTVGLIPVDLLFPFFLEDKRSTAHVTEKLESVKSSDGQCSEKVLFLKYLVFPACCDYVNKHISINASKLKHNRFNNYIQHFITLLLVLDDVDCTSLCV